MKSVAIRIPNKIGPGTHVRVREVVQTLFPSRTIQGLALSNVLEHDGASRWVISLFLATARRLVTSRSGELDVSPALRLDL